MCEAITILLNNIYIRYGSKLYRQIVGNLCPSCSWSIFLYCYEWDFILSLTDDNQSEVIETFHSTPPYLDDLLNGDNDFFDSMVNHIYPSDTIK